MKSRKFFFPGKPARPDRAQNKGLGQKQEISSSATGETGPYTITIMCCPKAMLFVIGTRI